MCVHPERARFLTGNARAPRWNQQRFDLETKEHIHATRNDRTWTDGRQHGATVNHGRPRLRGIRHVAESRSRAREGEGDWRDLSPGLREKAPEAASGMADGASSGR